MNKIFKVVWSKTKECYVVVSEVAKNNGGKKKVLASVLAGLAMVGAGAQVQAYSGLGGHDNPAVETLAVGPDTWANQEAAVAVGMHNNANGQPAGKHSVAIGSFSNANGEISIAMGGVTNASGKMSVAVGYRASATDEAAVALGNMVSADKNSTGVGPGATASGTYAFAGGYQSETTGISGVAIGDNAKAKAARAMAIGGHAEATAEQAIAIGSDTGAGNKTTASKKNAIAVGHGATASGLDTAAIGTSATASGQSSVALGNGTQSTNLNTTAIGSNVQSTKTGSIGIGGNVESIGDYSVAIGSASAGKTVKAVDYATAVGGLSNAAERAAALGAGANAAQARSVAIGYKATASTADGVAIGSTSVASTAAGVQGFNPADSRTNKYGGLTSAAQTSTLAAVSIGNGSAQTRQITGLAAGKEDTDAVNVAQLRSVNLKYAADTGNSDFLLTDGTLTVNGDGDLISTSVESTGAIKVTAKKGGNITHTDGKAVKPTTNGIATTDNVVDAINDSYWKATAGGNTVGTVGVGNVKPGNKVTFSAGDNLKVKQSLNNTTGEQEYTYSLNPVLTGITSIANTATGPKMTFGGNSINITGGSLDMGTNKITNLAPGTADNDAVNVKQLKDTELHITPGTYTPDANKKVKLTYTDGNNTVVNGKEAVIDLSGLATGGTASTEKVKKATNGTNDTNIAEVNPQTGDTFGGAGATYEVSVSRNAVKDAAREAVTVNNGGTTTGGTYTADTNNPISVTAKPDNTNHNTTYEVTFDGNKAAKQIPLTYKATNGTITTADQTVKLDKGLNFTGGDYTTASVGADGKVTFDVNLGTAPTVTDGKPGVPGQAGAAGKDGIATVKTVVDTINNSGWKANAKANGGTLVGSSTATVVKPGDQVNFAAGKNLTVKQDLTGEHTYTYSLNKDIDLTNAGSLTVGDTTVNNGGITIKAPTPAAGTTPTTDVKLTNTGLDNGGNKIVNVAEGTADTDAVNVKQLKDAKTVLADGKNTKKSGTGTAADPYKVNVEGDLTGISSITNGGTNNGKISFGPNKTVTVDGDHSITLNASTGKIGGLQNLTFDPTNFTSGQAATEDQLKSVHDTLKASELHIAPTESNRTGEHIAGGATSNTAAGAAANAYKYDATTKQVVLEYNDGTGANKTGTKAVIDLSNLPTGGDMSSFKVTSSAESTTVGTHAGDASQEIKNGKSVDFQAGKNMTVKQTNDGNGNTTINYALDKNLDVESVHVGKDGKDGKIGIDGKDGVDGLDGTNRVDIHVEKGAKGVDGTDGHDGVNGHNGKDGMTRIVYEDKGGKQEVATLNDGMKYAGDDAQGTDKTKVIAKKLNETLDIIGGANKADLTTDNIGVNNDGNGKLLVQLSKNLKGINTIKNGGTTITLNDAPGGATNTPAVTISGGNLSVGGNKVTNVDDGTNDNDAVNLKQLKASKTEVKAGENVTVKHTTDGTDNHNIYTVSAVTPAVYTKADGTKVYKIVDPTSGAVTWNTSPDGNGTVVNAGDVITSFETPANGTTKGSTTGGTMIVNNVGSAINNHATPGVTSPTYLDKLDAAAGDNNTKHAAVNVTDLKNTADGLTEKGLKFDANVGGVKTNKLGSIVKVQGAGTGADANYSGANIKTFIDQDATGNTTIDVKLDKNLAGINSITGDTNSGKLVFQDPTATVNNGDAFKFTGGNNITNLKSGIVNNNATDDTNGANIGDVKKIAKASDLHIAPTAGTTNNVTEYTVDANNKVTLTYQDGNGTAVTAPKAVIDLSALANKITSGYTFNTNATANGGTVANDATTPAAVTAVANGGTINYAAGKNLTVKQDIDTTNKTHTYTYSLDKDINVETVTVTGQNGKDGKIGINGKNGTNGVNGTNRVDIQVEKGVDGIDGKNGTDGISRIVYEDKTGTHTVATMDDGLKFTGNNTVIENKQKLGSLVKVQGEGTKEGTTVINPTTGEKELVLSDGTTKFESAKDNIAVVADGTNTLTVKLNKKLTGLDSVQTKTVELGDHTTPGGTTNITYNTGDKRIEYTTPGATPGTTVTKKVATTDDIWTIQGNGTDVAPVGGKVNVKAGENILITTPATADGSMTINAVTPAVYTDKNGNKLTKDKDGKFHKPDGTEVAAADVITSIQDASGNVTGGNSIVNNVGSAIKNLGNTGDNYLTKLDLANTATPNAAVNVSDLKNTADALKSNELHIRPTTSGRTGETVNKNTAGTAESYKYDAATKSVTLKYNDGTGAGVTGTEAKIDLSGLADQITSGYTFSTNAKGNLADGTTATATAVGNGKTVSFAAGKNLTVEQNIDATTGEHTYTYALSDKITAGKDGVNGKDGSVGVTGKDGSSVVINGADGSIGMTGPKGQAGKDGINGRDGANLSMTSAKGEQVLVNRDPAHNADTDKAERIVYVPKDASGNPIQDANGKNIVREVATMDDGLKFTGNNESTENKHKLGSLVKVQGEGVTENTTTNKLEANGEEFKSASGNIAVVADSIDKLTVKLNKNLAGINKISNGGSSITLNDTPNATTPAVTITGGNLSLGDGTTNNKIVNVAPGTDDSDAVNYKQLKDAKTVLANGKNTTKSGTGTAADPYKVNVEGDLTEITSITNKADASGNAGKITFSPNQTVTVNGDHNITLDAGSGHIGGLTNLTFNPNSYTSGQAATEDQLKSVHDTLKANERHIAPTTVATGSTETKGGTVNAAGTANVYKYDAASKTVTLTYNDGNGHAVTDTKAVIDLSNLSTGGTGASSWNVKSSANTTDGGAVDANHNANAQNIADGKSVEFQSGKNLVVKQTNDTTNGNATVEFSLSDNITVGKDGANGKDGSVGAKGADGSAVVMNGKDGSIGLNGTNGANGISIKGKDGANGVGIDGKDGVTRIVYTEKVPDPANPGTTKEVTHEVATMDDGLKFTGNNTATENKHKLGSLVKVQGEGVTAADEAAFQSASGNIAVTADGTDTLTIRLNKNLKGLNSIQLGGNTIQSNGDNITFTTNGGTTKTVATTDQLWTIQANGTDVPATNGKVNVVGKDGITVAKNAAGNLEISGAGLGTMNGFDVTANNGATSKTIDNGKKVDFNAGSNLTVKQTNDANGTHIEYALKEAVDLGTNGSLKAGDTTVNKDGVTIANGPSITTTGVDAGSKKITNVADGAVNATSKDAVNGSQLKKYTDAAKTTVEAGDNNVKVDTDTTAADGHTNYKVSLKPVVTIGDTHKVKIDGQTGDITGLTNVDLTDPTFATKGRAATEEQLKQVLTEAKKKAVEKVQAGTAAAGDTNIATVAPKAGDTFGAAGATYEVSVSKNAVKDAAKEAVKVTSVSPAITVTPDTSVAHETTYKVGFDGAEAAKSIPLTYKANGSGGQTVTLDKGLDFKNGTNTTARIAPNGQVFYDVNPNLQNISSISGSTTGNGPRISFNNAGANSTVNIDGGNLNMNNNKITHVAPGTDGTDAVNLDQLKAARTKVTSNDGTVSVNRSENTATGEITYDLHVTPGQSPDLNRVNNRIDQLGEEIGRVGAQGAALSALKPIQYDPLEPTQIMAGYGNYRGNSAVALGVAHYKNESTLIHGGVSWAGGSSHMMANAGVTWKVGNRDSEAAVADRYRKGPISSAYAMQQEMAAMKAQNAGLKGEVSDLKAENEQMKAQIAAMMAKLGL